MRNALVLLLVPLSLGCGLVKVKGLGNGAGSSSSSGSSSQAAAAAADTGEARPSAADAEPLKLRANDKAQAIYASISYKQFPADGPAHFLANGVEQNYSLKKGQNPDPSWLTGWDRLSGLDEPKAAVVQAAINRTWTADVHAEHKQVLARRKALEATLRPRLAEANALPFYPRRDALAALWADLGKAAEAEGVVLDEVGLPAEIVAAMVAAHRDAGAEFVLASYLNEQKIDLGRFQTHGRPFAPDDVERDLYTASAQASGTATIPKLPSTRQFGEAFSAIAWPTSDARDRKTAAVRDELIATFRPQVEYTIPPSRSVFNGEAPVEGQTLAWLAGQGDWTPLTVTKVGEGTLTLGTRYEQKIPYDCRLTNRFDPNSRMCFKVKTKITSKDVVVVAFDALPVEIKKGDELELYGDVTKETQKGDNRTLEVKLRAVTKVVRGGKTILGN